MENATGAARKKDKPTEEPIPETMDTETTTAATKPQEPEPTPEDITKDLAKINSMCDELLNVKSAKTNEKSEPKPTSLKKEATPKKETEKPKETIPAPKVDAAVAEKKTPARKTFNKGKTVDLSGTIDKATDGVSKDTGKKPTVERKNSLPDESSIKAGDRRKSRILETAEKFQSMNNQNNEKYKKFVIPGVSVGSFKKEFERKASITSATVGPLERKQRNSESTSRQNSQEDSVQEAASNVEEPVKQGAATTTPPQKQQSIKESDSKSSVGSFSLEDARKSMENSIALLKKEKSDSEKEISRKQQQPTIPTSAAAPPPPPAPEFTGDGLSERERKLKNAREIISNAIPRLGGGSSTSAIRRPPMPFGTNGRTPSGNLATGYSKPVRLGDISNTTSANSTPTTMPEHAPSFVSSKGKKSQSSLIFHSLELFIFFIANQINFPFIIIC